MPIFRENIFISLLRASLTIYGRGMRTQFRCAMLREWVLCAGAKKSAYRKGKEKEGNFAHGEYTHDLRLSSELDDLRSGYANPIPLRYACGVGSL